MGRAVRNDSIDRADMTPAFSLANWKVFLMREEGILRISLCGIGIPWLAHARKIETIEFPGAFLSRAGRASYVEKRAFRLKKEPSG